MHEQPDLPGLRRHHLDGREQARRLGAVAGGGPQARGGAAAGFLEYFDREVIPHMRAEERGLLPLLLSGDPRVVRVLREHERLYALARRLRETLAEGAPPGQDLQRIADLLQDHIALEERDLYPEAAERLAQRDRRRAEGHWRPAPEGDPA